MKHQLRHSVFWPPFILLILALLSSLIDKEGFHSLMVSSNNWILDTFGSMFSITALLLLVTCVGIFLSPAGKIKIGGNDAKPFLNRWQLFSIVLCTTIATGILFWGTAEPIYHVIAPPKSLGIQPESAASANFAMSTMFLHWSFTPYAIYSIPALTFALMYYNKNKSFSLGSTLHPLTKNIKTKYLSTALDIICLFALVAGMAASLGTGILMLAGGIAEFFDFPVSNITTAIVCLLIVVSFIISAGTGLLKGIRILSTFNVLVFFAILITMFVFGPTRSILQQFAEGIQWHLSHFVESSLIGVIHSDAQWPRDWTVFYWANWMAWAPITALFLGRIAYGYTVRQFLLYNWIVPSLFAIVWMSVFSGIAIDLEMNNKVDLANILQNEGYESVIYAIFDYLPIGLILPMVFIGSVFISYVTAADSNTEAMSGISSTGISPDAPDSPLFIKILWGVVVGAIAWTMISFAGIDGVRYLSNLGGLPVMFLLLAINLSIIIFLIRNHRNNQSDVQAVDR